MNTKKTVLIHADEKQRDIHSMIWIAHYLEEFGFDVYVCNKLNRSFLWNRIKPDIMIDSHTNYYDEETLKHRTKYTKILILSAEGSIFNKHILSLLYEGENKRKKENVKYITKYLVWGSRNKEWLIEQNILDETQIEVVGCPRYDIYKNFKQDKNPSKIGILTMFKTINVFDSRNTIKFIDDLKSRHGYNFDKDRNVEDLFWYYVAGCRVVLELLEKLFSTNNFLVKIRPHQTEASHNYNFLSNKFNNKVKVEINNSFYEWLKNIYILIVIKSTSVVETFLMGIPVISLENLMGDRLNDHMKLPDSRIPFLKFCWNPKSYDELVDLCSKAKNKELDVSPNLQGFQTLTKEFFDHPRNEPSSLTIAKTVDRIYKENINFFKNKKKTNYFKRFFYYHVFNRIIYLKNRNTVYIKSCYFPWEKKINKIAKKNWNLFINGEEK